MKIPTLTAAAALIFTAANLTSCGDASSTRNYDFAPDPMGLPSTTPGNRKAIVPTKLVGPASKHDDSSSFRAPFAH